jgi:hypothetical protein
LWLLNKPSIGTLLSTRRSTIAFRYDHPIFFVTNDLSVLDITYKFLNSF